MPRAAQTRLLNDETGITSRENLEQGELEMATGMSKTMRVQYEQAEALRERREQALWLHAHHFSDDYIQRRLGISREALSDWVLQARNQESKRLVWP